MNKKVMAIPAVTIVIVVILAIFLAQGNFFSANIPSEPTPTPQATSAAYAMTIDYSETSRQNTGYSSIDVNIAMQARTNDGNTRNMILENFYVTVDGVEVKAISQTTGNFYVEPGYARDAMLTMRLPSGTGTNYKLNYRDSSFSIEWNNTTPAPSPTPYYAITLRYTESGRRPVTSNDVQGPYLSLVGDTYITIEVSAQNHMSGSRVLTYENFYVTVDGVEKTPEMQLKGTWGFQTKDDSIIWFIFKEIGTNYELNYRDDSFRIEWIAG